MARPCWPIWFAGPGGWSAMPGPWPSCTVGSTPSRPRPTCPLPWAGNLVLTASGPMVIDWPNAGRGDGLADVATTWVILRTSRLEGPVAYQLVAAVGQRWFAAAFLAGFDRRQVFQHLPAVVAARLADRNVHDRERRLLRRLTGRRR